MCLLCTPFLLLCLDLQNRRGALAGGLIGHTGVRDGWWLLSPSVEGKESRPCGPPSASWTRGMHGRESLDHHMSPRLKHGSTHTARWPRRLPTPHFGVEELTMGRGCAHTFRCLLLAAALSLPGAKGVAAGGGGCAVLPSQTGGRVRLTPCDTVCYGPCPARCSRIAADCVVSSWLVTRYCRLRNT